jgi:hypothetical protein
MAFGPNMHILGTEVTTLDAWQLTFSPTGSALRLRLFFIIVSGLGYAKRPELYAWQLV